MSVPKPILVKPVLDATLPSKLIEAVLPLETVIVAGECRTMRPLMV
jgi:hypothetical protein